MIADLFWRLLPDVRVAERARFLFFASLALLVTMAQTLGLVGSEALFLARFGAERLPETFIAASLLTVVGSFLYALVVGRARNDDLFVWMLVGTVIVLAGAAAGVAADVAFVLPALFCLYYLLQAVFLNHFFTFAVDYFDAAASRRLFPRFTIAASVGGAVGGGVGVVVASLAGPTQLIAAWGVLYLVCAVILRVGRSPLRRWGPLDLEEADETSVEGMRGAAHYLRSSSLGRYLAVSALGMVAALFVAQYLYSDIFVRAFPDPADLAIFFGVYLAVTNAIEIGIGFKLTPWLIQRMGVASANLIHPLLTLASFGALAAHYGLSTGILARVNRELVDNATGFPIRSLVYNAMPMRLRGRMRAFLEGIVVYAGMSGAGALLLLLGAPDPLLLAATGAAASLVFLGANVLARREYQRSLVSELRSGASIQDVVEEIGVREATQLAELWEQMLQAEKGRPSRSLLEIIPRLADRGIVAPVVRETAHPSPEVRRSCVTALAKVPGEQIDAVLRRALADPEPEVRLAALHGAKQREPRTSDLEEAVRARVQDPNPEIRAEAARDAGADGIDTLEKMALSDAAEQATAALAVAPPPLVGAALARARDPDPAIRAAGIEAVARLAEEPLLSESDAASAALDPDPRVRSAALRLLARFPSEDALTLLACALADGSDDVAATAQKLLGELGDAGVEAASAHLRVGLERANARALGVLAAAGAEPALREELRWRVRELWHAIVAYQRLPHDDSLPSRFLAAAFADSMMRSRRLAFRVLELIGDPAVIRKVERALRMSSRRARGNALEVLSNLGDREASQLLVLLHERGPLPDKLRVLSRWLPLPLTANDAIKKALESDLPYLQMGARALTSFKSEATPEEVKMERLLVLKEIPLFSHLSLEQLDAVLELTSEKEYSPEDVIFYEGDPGGILYILIEGSVHIFKLYGDPAQRLLETLHPVSYFGEMAILDDATRSATVVAAEDARILTLEGGSLKELIQQMPHLSFDIFRVLTARVRKAEGELEELQRSLGREGVRS